MNGRLSYHNVTREDGTVTKLANVNVCKFPCHGRGTPSGLCMAFISTQSVWAASVIKGTAG